VSQSAAAFVRRILPIILVLAIATLGAALLGPLVQDGLDAGGTDAPTATAPPLSDAPATLTPVATAATETAAPIKTLVPENTPVPEPSVATERIIDIEATAFLAFLDGRGDPLRTIGLWAGQRVQFRVNNTAGYAHSFYLGPAERLRAGDTEGLPGIPAWTSGIQTLSWVVPEDGTEWAFGCTVTGHHILMNGQLMIVDGP